MICLRIYLVSFVSANRITNSAKAFNTKAPVAPILRHHPPIHQYKHPPKMHLGGCFCLIDSIYRGSASIRQSFHDARSIRASFDVGVIQMADTE